MGRCSVALGGTAALAAAVDLGHKAANGAEAFHGRSGAYVAVVVVLVAAWAGAIVLARSLPMALGGGIAAGGAAGNVLSLAFWPGVPNPIVVPPIAFNLADVFVLAGFVVVATAAGHLAVTNPARLREPLALR